MTMDREDLEVLHDEIEDDNDETTTREAFELAVQGRADAERRNKAAASENAGTVGDPIGCRDRTECI